MWVCYGSVRWWEGNLHNPLKNWMILLDDLVVQVSTTFIVFTQFHIKSSHDVARVDIFTRGRMIFVNEVGWLPSNHQWWLGFTSISLESINLLPPVFLSVEAVMISSPWICNFNYMILYTCYITHRWRKSPYKDPQNFTNQDFFGSCHWWVLLSFVDIAQFGGGLFHSWLSQVQTS